MPEKLNFAERDRKINLKQIKMDKLEDWNYRIVVKFNSVKHKSASLEMNKNFSSLVCVPRHKKKKKDFTYCLITR